MFRNNIHEVSSENPEEKASENIKLNVSDDEKPRYEISEKYLVDSMKVFEYSDEDIKTVTDAIEKTQAYGQHLTPEEKEKLERISAEFKKNGVDREANAIANLYNPDRLAVEDANGEHYKGEEAKEKTAPPDSPNHRTERDRTELTPAPDKQPEPLQRERNDLQAAPDKQPEPLQHERNDLQAAPDKQPGPLQRERNDLQAAPDKQPGRTEKDRSDVRAAQGNKEAEGKNTSEKEINQPEQKSSDVKKKPDTKETEKKEAPDQEKKALTPADEKKIDNDFKHIEKKQNQIASVKDVASEKAKVYSDKYIKNLSETEDKLKQSVEETKGKIEKLDKNDPAYQEKLDSLNNILEKRTKQLEKVQDVSAEAKDFREQKKLDEDHDGLVRKYDDAQKLSDKSKSELMSYDYEDNLNKHKEELEARRDKLDERLAEREEMGDTDSAEYRELKDERGKRDQEIAKTDEMLEAAKEQKWSQAVENSSDRLKAHKESSGSEIMSDLNKDKECINNNKLIIHDMKKEKETVRSEKEKINSEINALFNDADRDKPFDMEKFDKLCGEYDKLYKKEQSLGHRAYTLESYTKELEEIGSKKVDENQSAEKDTRERKALTPADEKKIDKDFEKIAKKRTKNEKELNKIEKTQLNKIEKMSNKIDPVKGFETEKAKKHHEEYVNMLSETESKLKQSIDETKGKIEKLDKNDPAYQEKLDSLNNFLEKRTKQLDIVQSEKLDDKYAELKKKYDHTKFLSGRFKSEIMSLEYEQGLKDHKAAVKERLSALDERIAERKEMGDTDSAEYHELMSERQKRVQEIAGTDIMLEDTKEHIWSQALEDNRARLNAHRGSSEKEKKRDLDKDRECVRNNNSLKDHYRKELMMVRCEKSIIDAKLAERRQKIEPPDLFYDKEYQAYGRLSREKERLAETLEGRFKTLDMDNERLSEINGTYNDKKENTEKKLLPVEPERNMLNEAQIDEMIDRVYDRCKSVSGKVLDNKMVAENVSLILDAERHAIPTLVMQILDKNREIFVTNEYMKNNPLAKSSTKAHCDILNAECAAMVGKLCNLVEGVSILRDSMAIDQGKKKVKVTTNSDGTYTLEQRWTNTREKKSDTKHLHFETQLFDNGYDHVSTVTCDADGRIIAHEWSFKYKMLGIISKTKFVGKLFGINNTVEGGLVNAKLGGGFDERKAGRGEHLEVSGSLVGVEDNLQLQNAYNRTLVSMTIMAAFAQFNAEAKIGDDFIPKISVSGGPGGSMTLKAEIAGNKVFEGTINVVDISFSENLSGTDILDGKTNIVKTTKSNEVSLKSDFGPNVAKDAKEMLESGVETVFESSNKIRDVSNHAADTYESMEELFHPEEKTDTGVPINSEGTYDWIKELMDLQESGLTGESRKKVDASIPDELRDIKVNTSDTDEPKYSMSVESLIQTLSESGIKERGTNAVLSAVKSAVDPDYSLSESDRKALKPVLTLMEKRLKDKELMKNEELKNTLKEAYNTVANLCDPGKPALEDAAGEHYTV